MAIDLSAVPLININQPLIRNIVSLRDSQQLFDDLTDNPDGLQAATALEAATKPLPYASHQSIIHRPFEEAEFLSAILYPFEPNHWSASRFSTGEFGVWYGSDSIETGVHETAYHWRYGLLADAGWEDRIGTSIERRIHQVNCHAHLVDLTNKTHDWPGLTANHYDFCRDLGTQAQHDGLPGLWTPSARSPRTHFSTHADTNPGTNAALFTPAPLSAPTTLCWLTYTLSEHGVLVHGNRSEPPWMVL